MENFGQYLDDDSYLRPQYSIAPLNLQIICLCCLKMVNGSGVTKYRLIYEINDKYTHKISSLLIILNNEGGQYITLLTILNNEGGGSTLHF